MIQINDDWRIQNDELNCTLERKVWVPAKKDKPGHYKWNLMGYYPTRPGDRGLKLAYQAAMELDCVANRDMEGVIKQLDVWHGVIAGLQDRGFPLGEEAMK